MQRIPMVDLQARHAEVAEEVERGVLEVLRGGRWVGGPRVAEAEALAARWLGRPAAVGVASGTDALMLGLQVAGVQPGDEVLVPALTFFATAGAVAAIGAVPVVVDVGEDALLDPEAAEAAVGHRTRAIVPVHLFGNLAPAPDLGLIVVDDAAQAVGTAPAPSVGVLTAVSAYPTKTWGAAGDAGFVVGDPAAVEAVRALAFHGQHTPGVHERIGGHVGRTSRLDAVQAAVLCGHAPRLEERVARRRALAERYDAGLPARIRPLPRQAGSAVHHYCVLVEDRPRTVAALRAAGIGHAVYYPEPLSRQPALRGLRAGPTPTADWLSDRLLALPIAEHMDDARVDRVLQVLGEVG